MGLEQTLFKPEDSPYRKAALKSFLGSRLQPETAAGMQSMIGGSPAPVRGLSASNAGSASGPTPQQIPALQSLSTGAGADMPGLSKDEFSSSFNPVLAKIHAAGLSDVAQAENDALAGKRNVLQRLGDRTLAEQLLGSGDPTLGSISGDPEHSESTLARIARAYAQTLKSNEDTMNEDNLFYSGFRGNRLKELSQQRTDQETDASSQAQDALQQIGAALLAKKNAVRDNDLAAQESEFQNRLANPGTSGAGAGGGGAPANPSGFQIGQSVAGFNADDVALGPDGNSVVAEKYGDTWYSIDPATATVTGILPGPPGSAQQQQPSAAPATASPAGSANTNLTKTY